MAEIIGLIVFLLCIVVWGVILMNDIRDKKRMKRNDQQSLKKQEEVETRIRKIEDVYGEKATLIMFQELNAPNICELLVILEEAQIILILGEAYNFSEILNLKMGQLDYIRLKYTDKSTAPTSILEQAATGLFSTNTIKGALKRLEDTQEAVTSPLSEEAVKIDIMTSRLDEPVITICPSCHTLDEIIVALSMIIDKNESKWTSVEISQKQKGRG
ncbi:hypothetical protein D0T87_16005 [Bacteroides sp. 51]|nr:hypothetical protein [Bacteroides sp. 51]